MSCFFSEKHLLSEEAITLDALGRFGMVQIPMNDGVSPLLKRTRSAWRIDSVDPSVPETVEMCRNESNCLFFEVLPLAQSIGIISQDYCLVFAVAVDIILYRYQTSSSPLWENRRWSHGFRQCV